MDLNSTDSINNISWSHGSVEHEKRIKRIGQNPLTIWFTGLSGSGKSALSIALESALFDLGYLSYVLDGDNVRYGLNKDLGFSLEERSENIRRISEVAKLMNDAGLIVIVASISPYLESRDLAKNIIGLDRIVEIYINTPIEVCEERDPKGLYSKARKGLLKNFTGIDAPYETPISPDIILDTSILTISDLTEQILRDILRKIDPLSQVNKKPNAP